MAAAGMCVAAAALGGPFAGDVTVSRWLQAYQSDIVRNAMVFLSTFWGAGTIVVFYAGIVVTLLLSRQWPYVVLLPLGATSTVVSTLLKFAIARPRPSIDLIQVADPLGSPGFPSGHAMNSFVLLALIWYLVGRLLHGQPRLVLSVRVVLVALIVGIGVSRVYLGAHWASDVIGGWMVGACLVTALLAGFEAWVLPRFRRAPGATL